MTRARIIHFVAPQIDECAICGEAGPVWDWDPDLLRFLCRGCTPQMLLIESMLICRHRLSAPSNELICLNP